jgi:hypothetical protein
MCNHILTLCIQLSKLQVLKPACIAALRRIFKLCDTNKDGILDAAELNEFQVGFPISTLFPKVHLSLEEMFRCPFTIAGIGRYQGHGTGTCRRRRSRRRLDGDRIPISPYDVHSARETRDDLDGVEKVRICRRSEIDRVVFITQVRRVLLLQQTYPNRLYHIQIRRSS